MTSPSPDYQDFRSLLTSRPFVVSALLGLVSGMISTPAAGTHVYVLGLLTSPFAGAILFYVAWRFGRMFVATSALFGVLYALTVAGLSSAINYLLCFALPAALVIEYAHRRGANSVGQAPLILVLFFAALIVAANVLLGVIADSNLQTVVKQFIDTMVPRVVEAIQGDGFTLPDTSSLHFLIVPYVAGVWIFMTWGGLKLGAALAARKGETCLPLPDLKLFRNHVGLLVSVAALGLVATLSDGHMSWFAGTIGAILGLSLTFQGLAVVHVFIVSKTDSKWPFYALYVFALFTADISFILMAVLGVIDELASLRQKLQEGSQQGDL